MKVAVCISGLPRGNVAHNLKIIKSHFGEDVFFQTWKGQEDAFKKLLPDTHCEYYSEPYMDYHCLTDVPESVIPPTAKFFALRNQCLMNHTLRERTKHHTKQIFAHSYLLEHVPEEFDMIVRIRYDTYLSPKVNFTEYLERSYEKNIAIGFGTRTTRHTNLHRVNEVPKIMPDRHKIDGSVSQDWGGFIMDPMIMHPRKMWDSNLVEELHNGHELLPAELGWYQILSRPFGDTHECYYGGAQIEKYLGSTVK